MKNNLVLALIHGIFYDKITFQSLKHHLEINNINYDVIFIERPHYLNMKVKLQREEEVEAIIKEIQKNANNRKIILLGHSLGGLICFLIAAKLKSEVIGIISIDAPYYFRTNILNAEQLDDSLLSGEIVPDLNKYIENNRAHLLKAASIDIDLYNGIEIIDCLQEIQQRVCIIHGLNDHVVSVRQAKKIDEYVGNCELHLIDNSHNGIIEDANCYIAIIKTFIERVINSMENNNFNSHATEYSNWSTTRNVNYSRAFFDFMGIGNINEILDVACGSGDFLIANNARITKGTGIDSSTNLISIAKQKAKEKGVENLEFIEGDFNTYIFQQKFDVVTCRMALHHFQDINRTIYLMKNVASDCVCIQDILGFESAKVQDFMQKMEKLIDSSHIQMWTQKAIESAFITNGIEIEKCDVLEMNVELETYMKHSTQTEKDIVELNQHMQEGLDDMEIAQYLYKKNDKIYFKRKVLLLCGKKCD